MTLKPITAALFAAGALLTTTVAWSADALTKDTYKAEKNRIKAEYKSEIKRCDPMTGNAKDVCKKEVKGKEKSSLADAEARYKGTDKAATKAMIARADADYDVAKEKCDDLKGNAKDVCKKDAKAAYTKAKVDAKANAKVTEVRKDAREDKNDANYAAAKERCDALSGDAKAKCTADVKARFGKS